MNTSRRAMMIAAPLLALLSASTHAQEQPEQVLDLRQSVVYALSNNYRVQAETVSVEYADRQVQERRGAFDPSVSLSGSNYRDEDGSSHPTGSGHEYSAALSGELPTGTSYTAGVSSFDRDGVATDSKSSSGITLSVRQNLLKGFGLSANLAPIRVAARNASISRARFEKEMSDLVTETQFAYFDVVLANEYARVARESLELANRLYEENVRREAIQSIAGSEVYQAQSEVAARREALFEAERALGDARNYLKLLICADASSARAMDFDLVPLPQPEEVIVDAAADYPRALELRPDYRQAVLGLERDQIDALRASNAALPDVEAFADVYLDGVGDGMNRSLSRARDEEKPDFSAGIRLSYSIPNRSARAQKAMARLQERRAKITLRQLELEISIELENGARRVECDWNRLQTARESRELAELSLRAEQRLYDTGNSSTFILIRLQTDLMNAKLRELVAQSDYRKALVEYQRTLGTALVSYNIVTP